MTDVSEGRRAPLLFWSIRSAIALIGVFLSVVLHELYHVLMHWGDVVAFRIFPAPFVVAEVEFIVHPGHSMVIEEIIAYSVSSLAIIATIAILLALPHKKSNEISTASYILNSFRNALERVGA